MWPLWNIFHHQINLFRFITFKAHILNRGASYHGPHSFRKWVAGWHWKKKSMSNFTFSLPGIWHSKLIFIRHEHFTITSFLWKIGCLENVLMAFYRCCDLHEINVKVKFHFFISWHIKAHILMQEHITMDKISFQNGWPWNSFSRSNYTLSFQCDIGLYWPMVLSHMIVHSCYKLPNPTSQDCATPP